MDLKRFLKNDGTEAIIVPYSNNKRWCIAIFDKNRNFIVDEIFETEEDAVSWAQNFIKQ